MARLHRVEVTVADAPVVFTIYHMSIDDILTSEGQEYIHKMLERRGYGGREYFVSLPGYDLPKRTVPHIQSNTRITQADYIF